MQHIFVSSPTITEHLHVRMCDAVSVHVVSLCGVTPVCAWPDQNLFGIVPLCAWPDQNSFGIVRVCVVRNELIWYCTCVCHQIRTFVVLYLCLLSDQRLFGVVHVCIVRSEPAAADAWCIAGEALSQAPI